MVTSNVVLDEMIEFAVEELLSGSPDRRRSLVRNLAEDWPDTAALTLAFVLTSAAAQIDEAAEDEALSEPAVALGYRLSALVAADIFALQIVTDLPPLTSDLLRFWRNVDPLFRRQ